MRISDWSSDVCSSDLDLGMAAAAFMIALLLRLGDEAWRSLMTELWPPMLLFTAVCGIVFLTTGLYRGVWRYASMNDLVAIIKAVSLSLAVFLPVTFLITRLDRKSHVCTPVTNAHLVCRLLLDKKNYHTSDTSTTRKPLHHLTQLPSK